MPGPFTKARRLCLAALAVLALLWPGLARAAEDGGGYVGLQIKPVTLPDMQRLALPTMSGVLVYNVLPDGPGEKAGFLIDDVIQEYAGAKIMGFTHMLSLAKAARPGDKVRTKVIRAGAEKELTMVVGDKPKVVEVKEETALIDGLGTTVAVATPELRARLGILHNIPGLAVTAVAGKSPAENANISQGDVITAVGEKPVNTIAELRDAYAQALKAGTPNVVVRMMRGKDRAIAVVTPNR